MAAGVKHYFEDGTEYKGATHKSNGQLMSGRTHTASSKNLVHSPGKKAKKQAVAIALSMAKKSKPARYE